MKVAKDSVSVEDLVDEIQNAIQAANVGQRSSDLQVNTAQLILNVLAADGGGGKISFRIPVIGMQMSLGGKVSREDTHTIDVTLIPPPPALEMRSQAVSQVLVSAITTIRTIMQKAAAGQERLTLDTSSVELSFAVTREGGISLGFDGELRDHVTHTIKLTLGPPTRKVPG